MKTETYHYKIPRGKIIEAQLLDCFPLQMLLFSKSGNIYLWELENSNYRRLGKLPKGMDSTKKMTVYTHHKYICIVAHRNTQGLILHLEKPDYYKVLKRGDYQVEHCSYPIAFYEKEGLTYLIHGTDWNRLDITCLDTDELITNRLVSYEGEGKENYVDYFHSLLAISPDASQFFSNGWVWSPVDIITIYNTEQFLTTYEQQHSYLDFGGTSGYNWDRPACWIDNQHIAVGYDISEDEEMKENNSYSEILIMDALKNEIVDRFPFDGFGKNSYAEVSGKLFFDAENSMFIGLNTENGLTVAERSGQVLFSDAHLKKFSYLPSLRCCYQVNVEEEKNSAEIRWLLR